MLKCVFLLMSGCLVKLSRLVSNLSLTQYGDQILVGWHAWALSQIPKTMENYGGNYGNFARAFCFNKEPRDFEGH